MTQERRGGRPGWGRELVEGEGVATRLRSQVREHLRSSEKIIAALRAELTSCRQRNKELVEERNELLKALSRLQWVQQECTEATVRLQSAKGERDAEQQSAAAVLRENEELRAQCAALEAALNEKAAECETTREEGAYLEQQIVELEAIVELLERRLAAVRGATE
jgi:chromosome segregation ATPase